MWRFLHIDNSSLRWLLNSGWRTRRTTSFLLIPSRPRWWRSKFDFNENSIRKIRKFTVDICSNICLCCRRVVVGLDMTKIVVGDECLGLASLLDDDFDCDCGFDCAMNDDDDDCNANGTNYVSHWKNSTIKNENEIERQQTCWNRMNKTMNANDDGYSAIFA